MKRSFCLRRSTDFERVRRSGKSFLHPLVVLVVVPNQLEYPRIGIAAGRSVGGAVVRNRCKRLLRACAHNILSDLKPGYDVIMLARKPLPQAGFWKTLDAVKTLLVRASLLNPSLSDDEPRLRE